MGQFAGRQRGEGSFVVQLMVGEGRSVGGHFLAKIVPSEGMGVGQGWR